MITIMLAICDHISRRVWNVMFHAASRSKSRRDSKRRRGQAWLANEQQEEKRRDRSNHEDDDNDRSIIWAEHYLQEDAVHDIIILNPDCVQLQTSIPTKWFFLELIKKNSNRFREADRARRNEIAKDVLAMVRQKGYTFCHYDGDVDDLVPVKNVQSRYLGHIRQILVRVE